MLCNYLSQQYHSCFDKGAFVLKSAIFKLNIVLLFFTVAALATPWLERQRHISVSPSNQESPNLSRARIMPNGVSVPSDFPHVEIFINKAPSDDFIFINNMRKYGPYTIIFDNNGSPVWYDRYRTGNTRRDFKVQKNGLVTMLTRHAGQRYLGFDENFNLVDEFKATNGYTTDEHELLVLEDGSYYLLGFRNVRVDMSQIIEGGRENARVSETALQGYAPDHRLIFNWPALEKLVDHLPYLEFDNPKAASFRYPHMNAIDVDKDDGHLLLSCRFLSQVIKIDRQTGDIIWRLGGVSNQFTFVDDPLDGFRNQHDIRSLGNGLYSLFDNGNLREPKRSRAVIYKVDTTAQTATLVWEYRNPEGTVFSRYMGSHQVLPNGNSLINWSIGERPKVTEVTPEGEVVYEMNFVDQYHCYRTFRFPWHGRAEKPRLFVEQDYKNLVFIFNKFGDPDVAYYKIYGDTIQQPTAVIDTSAKTLKRIGGLENYKNYFFRVNAVNENGVESDFSNEEQVFTHFFESGQNLVRNFDFSSGTDTWQFDVTGAEAVMSVTPENELKIKVTEPGAQYSSIRVYQAPMPIVKGKRYKFEFDAYATAERLIGANIQNASNPLLNYSNLGPISLRRAPQHFSYEFITDLPSDYVAQLVFRCGKEEGDVFIDNVTLINVPEERPFDELPDPWRHQDIGEVDIAGFAGVRHDTFLVRGAGNGIDSGTDQFHFAYQKVVGDAAMSARALSLDNTDAWGKAGVMLRNSLDSDAKHSFMGLTAENGAVFQRRRQTGGVSCNVNSPDVFVPRFIKIVRQGDVFCGYESTDGRVWNCVGSDTIAMQASIYAGFAVTSNNNDELGEAMFDSLKVVTNTKSHDKNGQGALEFMLHAAYPNPFNPRTTITYDLPQQAHIKLVVYNVRGEHVELLVDKNQQAGQYSVSFHASATPSGIYFCRLEAVTVSSGARCSAVQKMTVIK